VSPKGSRNEREEKRIRAILIVSALAALVVGVGVAAARVSDEAKPQTHLGLTAEQWHARAVTRTKERNRVRGEVRMLTRHIAYMQRIKRKAWTRDATYAINLAASVFGVSRSEMWSVASCETGGTFSPFARNRSSSASGLFQFLDSTWASQGIAGFSVYDPVANALGAARIVARQGWRQWSCQPG
jgi:hypothetical protein